MKNNKLKQKWNSLPWYTRDVASRFVAAVGFLLFLMAVSGVAKGNTQKEASLKIDKTTKLIQENPERYQQLRDAYLMWSNAKEK